MMVAGPEAQDSIFEADRPKDIPSNLARAVTRMEFPPSYIVVGVYRLFTDKTLYKPVWDKCKHGTQRGGIIAIAWVRT